MYGVSIGEMQFQEVNRILFTQEQSQALSQSIKFYMKSPSIQWSQPSKPANGVILTKTMLAWFELT